MKRLHIFLIKSFFWTFISAFIVAIFLLLMQFLWKYIDDLVGKGLEVTQISQLMFYACARFVPIALPIAILLSSVMVFGKLAEQYELVALKASGISLLNIIKPVFVFVLFISIGSYLFSNYIMPIANLKNGSMIYDIQKKKPALNIKEGIFYKDIEGYSIKVARKDLDNKTLHDIIIYDHKENEGNNKVITAKSGYMHLTPDENFLELSLFDGCSYVEFVKGKQRQKKTHRTTYFEENLIRFDLSSFSMGVSSEKLYKGHYAMLNNNQLNVAIDSLEKKLEEKQSLFKENLFKNYHLSDNNKLAELKADIITDKKRVFDITINKLRALRSVLSSNKDEVNYRQVILAKHHVEWHRKISLAFACIILFLIGAPLGAIIRKGGIGMPVLISILFFVFYHVLSMIGEKSTKELTLEAFEGMWLSNIIFFPIALFLVYKATNDSILFDLNRFFNILKLSKKKD